MEYKRLLAKKNNQSQSMKDKDYFKQQIEELKIDMKYWSKKVETQIEHIKALQEKLVHSEQKYRNAMQEVSEKN